MKSGLALFDFDGTITRSDTLLEFIRFSRGNLRFVLGFLLNTPFILAYKAGFLSNSKAKEMVLRYFFRNMPLPRFNELCTLFARERLPQLIRPHALEQITQLKMRGFVVLVVSASPENWIQNWAKDLQVELLASKLEVINGRLTGNLEGPNCHGEEKVRRITSRYDLSSFDPIVAFGDTKGDLPMLKLAATYHYRPFRAGWKPYE